MGQAAKPKAAANPLSRRAAWLLSALRRGLKRRNRGESDDSAHMLRRHNTSAEDARLEAYRRELFQNLAHQVKEPLNLIILNAQSSIRAIEGHDLILSIKKQQDIIDIGRNTARLIDALLSLAWVDHVRSSGVPVVTYNLAAVLGEVVEHKRVSAEAKSVEIDYSADASLWVAGQRDLIREMFANLLDNAITHTPEASTVSVDARLLTGSRSLVVTITDQGPGIPPYERRKVMQPFYGAVGVDAEGKTIYGSRRSKALNGLGERTVSHGIGLAFVYAVADAHGASVSLEDGPGGIGLSVRTVLASVAPPEIKDSSAAGTA